ncbi:hypothetical protein DL98DRAFT_620385 [Cadophora sp. DSE1049]|nr:hypothetical protein DL98DRAFT_620385 [Cadophora sp. DSE1049]
MSSSTESVIDQLQASARKLPEKYENIHQLIKSIIHGLTPNKPDSESSAQPCREPTGKRIKIRKFKYFDKLPLEVRGMIWAECAHVPRVFQIDHYDPSPSRARWQLVPVHVSSSGRCQKCIQVFFCKEGGHVPVMLQVNQESRKEGLRYYKKPFGGIIIGGNPYFNFAADVLHFKSSVAVEVLFGHRYNNNVVMPAPCACSPISSAFKNLLSAKLTHLSVVEWSEFQLLPNAPVKFSVGMFQHLQTFTFGWEMVMDILSLIDAKKFQKMEDILGVDQTMSPDKLAMKFLHHMAMTNFLKVPKIKARKKSQANSKQPEKVESIIQWKQAE